MIEDISFLDGTSAACEMLLEQAIEACGSLGTVCDAATDPGMVDRRTKSEVLLTLMGSSDALGEVDASTVGSGAGPFPSFEINATEGPVVTRFEEQRTGDRQYQVVGEVACAPAGTRMTSLSEICDLDRSTPYCSPYWVSDPVYGQGS